MAKDGKTPIWKIVLVVIAVLLVLGAIGSMGGNQPSTSEPAGSTAQPAPAEPEPEPEPYTVSDEVLDTSNPFAVKIQGTLVNNTDKDRSYIQVSYNLYDADGAPVATALANTNNLKAGGVWKFEALGTAEPEQVASWELAEVTGF